MARYYLFANILKKALKDRIISVIDFKKTDEEVINKLINSKDKEILNKLNLLKKKNFFEESANGILLYKKFRFIDPEVLINNHIKKLSEIFPDYHQKLEIEKLNAKNARRILIKNE